MNIYIYKYKNMEMYVFFKIKYRFLKKEFICTSDLKNTVLDTYVHNTYDLKNMTHQ